MLAPIVLFVYNRPKHTLKTLQALSLNPEAKHSKLFIFCDGPKTDASTFEMKQISEVRSIVQAENWCGEVIVEMRDTNFGLAKNIVSGVTDVVNEMGRVIVLEDDIVTSIGFLSFMNKALEIYKADHQVMHVSGYVPQLDTKLPNTFFYNQTSCWGWATWNDSWKNFENDAVILKSKIDEIALKKTLNIENSYDFYGDLIKNIDGSFDTWAIKWHASVCLEGGLCLHPKKSLVDNIGFDGSGEHSSFINTYDTVVVNEIDITRIKYLKENKKARKAFRKFYNKRKPNKIRNLWNHLRSRMGKLRI